MRHRARLVHFFAIGCLAGGMAFFLLASMVGCSTVAGFGRDVQDAANWTSDRIDNGFNRPKR